MAHVYLLCGLAFAGKSMLAEAIRRHRGAVVVSLDEINAERGLFGGIGIPEAEWDRTHREALDRVEVALRAGQNVVVDDTNCFRFLRDNYRAVAERCGAAATVFYLDTPLDLVLERLRANNQTPSRAPVTEAVMLDLARKFEAPDCVCVAICVLSVATFSPILAAAHSSGASFQPPRRPPGDRKLTGGWARAQSPGALCYTLITLVCFVAFFILRHSG